MKNKVSSRPVRVLLAISATALLAACSSDIERLSDYPPIDGTASVAPQKVDSKPVPPLAGGNGGASPWSNPTPSWSRNGGYAAPVRSVAGNTARPPAPAYQPPRAPRAAANGTLVVQPGQTLFSIARANGKSVSELMAANGMRSPEIRVGQRLIIPGVANPVSPAPTVNRQVAAAPAPVPAPAATAAADNGPLWSAAPRAQRPARQQVQPAAAPARASTNVAHGARKHRVQPGETWYALGRRYGVHPRKIASYNGLSLNSGLRVGQTVKIPASEGWRMRGAASTAVASVRKQPRQARVAAVQAQPRKVASAPAPSPAPAKDQDRIAAPEPAAKPAATAPQPKLASARFAWPVRGRIIAGFGEKIGGARNEGVNIAAPAGAPVRAAADGVVAYAGNELKDYGNLILIRHADGWVTAYAHNRDLKVRRGDRVRRGQVIASVGSTGAVKSAQLHFEIRKGATPVNPMAHLGSATAMR